MDHLKVKRAWWSDRVGEFGEVRYGLEMMSGARDIQWLATSVREAEELARDLATEAGVPAELLVFPKIMSDEEIIQQREEREAAELEALKRVNVSTEWGVNPELVDSIGWPQLDRGDPQQNGWIPASERLAAIAAENRAFRATPSRKLLEQGDAAPKFRGEAFGIVNHPIHGRMAVTSKEFAALGLPEDV